MKSLSLSALRKKALAPTVSSKPFAFLDNLPPALSFEFWKAYEGYSMQPRPQRSQNQQSCHA